MSSLIASLSIEYVLMAIFSAGWLLGTLFERTKKK